MNFQKFSLREPLGGNPPDPHSQNHTTPLFSIHLRFSRELTPPDLSTNGSVYCAATVDGHTDWYLPLRVGC